MSKTDWALVALNVFTLLMAVVGLTAQHLDPMGMALVLTVLTTLVNGGWVLRRSRTHEPVAPRQLEADDILRIEPVDEMDIHRVLEIDQRLEALERAETRRQLELAEKGVISGPAAVGEAMDAAPRTRQRV